MKHRILPIHHAPKVFGIMETFYQYVLATVDPENTILLSKGIKLSPKDADLAAFSTHRVGTSLIHELNGPIKDSLSDEEKRRLPSSFSADSPEEIQAMDSNAWALAEYKLMFDHGGGSG
jgi:hypothetical protein